MEKSKPKIIFEDKYFLVLDKPAGMVVNNAETTKGMQTIQDWIGENISVWKNREREKGEEFKDFMID